jgi:branched-chain amino acid transport system ATP-binding protein
MSGALLELRALSCGYGSAQVLFDLDLHIAPGNIVTLLGRNGMGKTTTVRSIFGLTQHFGGSIVFDGADITKMSPAEIAARGIALAPEGRRIFPNLTVRENMIAFARRGAWNLDSALSLFPALARRLNNLGNRLSGGEQQMLAIARALVTQPRLLILDEASEGLAPLVRNDIWRVLATLKQSGLALLVIDKYLDKLLPLADHHVLMERGRAVWTGNSESLSAQPQLLHRYLGV